VIPEHLKQLLEPLGAHIETTAPNSTSLPETVVHVPGADHEYRFTPHEDGQYSVAHRRRNSDEHWTLSPELEQYTNQHQHTRLLDDMVSGRVDHRGPKHHLLIGQTLILHYHTPSGYTPELHREAELHYDDPNDKPFRKTVRHVAGHTDSTTSALIHAALHGRPHPFLHPLIDHLSETHGIELPLYDDDLHRNYARALDEQYRQEL
jgi:hypothetical protein